MSRIKTPTRRASRRLPPSTLDSGRLEILITIVNRSKADFYADLIQSFEVNMQLITPAQGTAKKEVLSYLGLASSEKAVIFSVIREDCVKETLQTLEEKFRTIKNGKGVALTVPMSSVIGVSVFGFLGNNKMTVKEDAEI